jgi:hypothetical protein
MAIRFPRVVDYSISTERDYWIELELYGYSNLGTYLHDSTLSISKWQFIFEELKSILASWQSVRPQQWMSVVNSARLMYIEKTETEFRNFYDSRCDDFDALEFNTRSPFLTINGKQYRNFMSIWTEVKQYIEYNISHFKPSLIHGDLCFNNILYEPQYDVIKFIDPRGSFDMLGIYGDSRYDVAKLYHSVDGKYEAFITDRFEVAGSENTFSLTIHREHELQPITNLFEQTFFTQYSQKHIKTIQGCMFIAMCIHHYDSLNRQKAMYLTGIRLLNEAMSL